MSTSSSPFYPPRSHWYNPLRQLWFRLGQFTTKFSVSTDFIYPALGWRDSILSLLIPGFAFRAFGFRLIGNLAMIYLGVAWLVFFIWLGHPLATIAYAGILSLHATSLSFLFKRFVPDLHLVFRLAVTLLIVLVLSVLVYGRLRAEVEKSFLPLRIGNEVVLVRATRIKNLKVGDYVAYRLEENSEHFENASAHGVVVSRSGFALEKILAGPGELVRFKPKSFEVNGKIFPRREHMPGNGEIILSQNQWFIWPTFAIQGGAPESEVTKAFLSYSIISEKEIVGRPFDRWLWRKQKLP